MAWSVTTSSLSSLEASWHGVDLTQVTATRSRGSLLASHPRILQEWLAGDAGRRVTLCEDSGVVQVWQDAIAAARTGMPAFSHERDFLNVTSSFQRVTIQVDWQRAHEITVAYEYVIARFQTRWANPLWGLVELDLAPEGDQVASLVTKLLEAMPPSRLIHLRIQDDQVAIPPGIEWEIRVEQGARALSTLLHLAGLAVQTLVDRLSRGWGLFVLGAIFTSLSTVWLSRMAWHWIRDLMGQVATG